MQSSIQLLFFCIRETITIASQYHHVRPSSCPFDLIVHVRAILTVLLTPRLLRWLPSTPEGWTKRSGLILIIHDIFILLDNRPTLLRTCLLVWCSNNLVVINLFDSVDKATSVVWSFWQLKVSRALQFLLRQLLLRRKDMSFNIQAPVVLLNQLSV